MPNWVDNQIAIAGEQEYLDELIKQVGTPYENPADGQVIHGHFLLWNIIRPTNLDAYLGKGEPDESADFSSEDFDPENFIAKAQHQIATGMDWWNWNVRNWGTKWEVNASAIGETEEGDLEFRFSTAWSPPVEALNKLAEQYPMLTFGIRAIDECENFAYVAMWEQGQMVGERELEVDHGVRMSFYDECWLCEEDINDPEVIAQRAKDGCDSASIAHLDFEPEED